MIRPHVPFATRYVDYGKVFVPNGALDFSTLAASDDEVARYGPQLFNRGLGFPETSPFAAQIGSVSAALLMFEGGYLFTILQRRREGELSTDPRTDRPFNQVRFVVLTRDMIAEAVTNRAAIYSGLAQATRAPDARVWLPDYIAGGQTQPWNPTVERLDPAAPDPQAIRFVTNALVAAARPASEPGASKQAAAPQPISVPLPAGSLLERLQLVEAVQYWALPRLGILTFALDYISIQNVHLRLFLLPPDAPAPLPPERIFPPGEGEGRFKDDYYTSVSTLEHEALYDPSLPGLLGLNLGTAEAVSLFKIEKQAEPFLGADVLRLYPNLARLGERRSNLLRRVPRDELLALLRQPDLPVELRVDLLQVAFDAAHGLLVHYGPAHLAVPRPARDDERVRAVLRASLAKSPEAALELGSEAEQAELFRDLLLARRGPPPASRSKDAAPGPLALSTGQTLLEALFLWRRTPALAAAVQEVVAQDKSLFAEALAVLDRATDLPGLLWLWQQAGQGEFKNYCGLLERAVQPAWYPALARNAGAWLELLAEGRALVAPPPSEPDPGTPAGVDAPPDAGQLLRALPRPLVPFVWQACLATSEQDAAFAEWWLYNEALAVPEQLPALWETLQRLPAAALPDASPQLNFLLGRATGLSLLGACTPPGASATNESLYAVVLRGWLASGFRSPIGDLVLATDDAALLVTHLPGSNDILAAISASPAQAAPVRALPADLALAWAQSATGARRDPYRATGSDTLFQRLIDLERPDEALLWHLLVEDDGSAPTAMPWPSYLALATRLRSSVDALQQSPQSRLPAYLAAVDALTSREVADTFAQAKIDIRQVLALVATHSPDPDLAADLLDSLLPLAVFHLQEPAPELKERSAALLRAALQQPDIPARLQALPDDVLTYLKEKISSGEPTLAAARHWIDAELARRHNALRVETPIRAAPPKGSVSIRPAKPAIAAATASAPPPERARDPKPAAAASPQTEPERPARPAATVPLVGQLALPGSTPKKQDSAVWLWVLIVVIVVLMIGVLIGAIYWIQTLPNL